MKIKFYKLVLLIGFIFLFQGCSFTQDNVRSIAQTNSAIKLTNSKNQVLKYLIEYKKKLDLRNPSAYNKNIRSDIYNQIKTNQDYINLIQDNKKLHTYQEYFLHAFSKEEVQNRNDLLIIGLYKLIYKAYLLNENHKFTAMQYNSLDMLTLYKYLQVIRWKIRTATDNNDNYLFVTWQNNWQLELMKKDISDLNIIKELKYIKNNEETVFSHSNFSFEVLITLMLANVEASLKEINVEPYELSISALKSFIFVL